MVEVLKRSLLIVLSVVLLAFAVLMLVAFVSTYKYVYIHPQQDLNAQPWRFCDYPYLLNYFNSSMMALGAICALATVDMIVCVAQNKYSMGMFGIGIAIFALAIVRIALSLWVYDFSDIKLAFIPVKYSRGILLAYTLGHVAFLCGFIGLAIAYICAKKKYLKKLPTE